MIQLPPDFKEFLRLLNARCVEYLVVGGYAVGYHGRPRATGDLDVWIAVDEPNAQRVMDALRDFGFEEPGIDVSDLRQPGKIFRMGMPPVRIGLMSEVSGLAFAACYARRVVDELDGVSVSFVNADDLKTNKRAAGRPKDRGDLEELP